MYGVCACVVYERIYVDFVCIKSLHLRIPPRVLHFSAVLFQQLLCKPTGHTVWPEKEIYESHFRTFCELVEGEENKTNYIFRMDYNARVYGT